MPKDTRHWPGDEHKVKLPDLEVKILCMGMATGERLASEVV